MIEKRLFYYMVTTLLLCIGMGARAANVVTISSAEGVPGEEVTVSIGLQNTDALSSMQLSIPLDENLTLVSGSAVVDNRCASHTANIGVNNGTLQIVVYSLSMATIAPGNGEVVSFKLKLGNEPLNATLQPSKIVLTGASGSAVNGSSESGTVTIRSSKAQFSTDEIDFGRVPIRSTYTQEVAVTNVGTADLVVNSLEFSDNVFSTSTQLPLTIAPGSTASLNVTFAPTMRGELERQLRIITNSTTQNRAIRLKAQPFAVNELHIGDASGISDEEVTVTIQMNNMDDINGYQVDFDLPSSLQYVDGSFVVNANRKQDHTGIATVVDGTLRLVVYSPSGKPLKGNDGEIGSFRVKLVGRDNVELAPTKTVLSAIINGKVENVMSAAYGGQVTVQYPAISTYSIINFGAVPVTADCKKTFAISNNGNAPLTITRIVFNNEHLSVAEQMPLVIASGDSKDVTVIYNSVEQKAFEATMQIYSNDPDKRLHEVKVTGSRFAPNYLDVNIPNVFEEDSLNIHLSLNTFDNVTGLQFDLNYPNNLYVPFENNVQLADRAKGLTVSSRQVSENTIRYVCYYLSGNGIAAGEGDIMTIQLKPVNALTPAGTYSVDVKNVTLGTAGLTNKYAGRDVERSFQVKKHNPIVITAKSYTREYGSANPVFGYNVEGTSVLYGSPDIRCDATETSPVGEYPIVITKGSVKNEEDSYVNGVLTITKASLNINAKSYAIKQGDALPTFEAEYSGFKNNETSAVLSKQPMFTCDATSESAPGTYDITVSGAEATNYDISYKKGTLTITMDSPITISANSYVRSYGDANPTFEYSVSGPSFEGTPEIICEATSTSPVGEYPIIIKKGSVTNGNVVLVPGTLTITKAPLTISAGNYTKKQGEAMPEWQPVYRGFKNGETSEVLTNQPVFTCDATAESRPGVYSVYVEGAEAENYSISYERGTLRVTEADLITVTMKNVSCEYGDELPAFEYEVTGGILDGEPEISCNAAKGSEAGEYVIVVDKGTIKNYNVSFVYGRLTITKAPLVIGAGNYTMKQGDPMPEWQPVAISGLKNGDTLDQIGNNYYFDCAADENSEPGEYEVGIGGYDETTNYTITYVKGTLTVTMKEDITIIVKSVSREYGEENPSFEYEVIGGDLVGKPILTCDAVNSSPVGEYVINIKNGTAPDNVNIVPGTLTITKAPLKVIAGTYTKKQGEAMPEFSVSYDGFKNEETAAVLSKPVDIICDANANSAPGEYDITLSGAEAQNYDISYTNGKLIVVDADAMIVKAKSYTREYGEGNPVFEFTTEGGELEGMPEIICEATETSPVGTYDIIVRTGSVANHNVAYVNGTLTITKAPLTISAGTYVKAQGEAMPQWELKYIGFRNNETKDVLTKQPVVSCDATQASDPGTYPVTVSGAEAQNYEISYVEGSLMIYEVESVTVTAKSYTREYGEDNPSFEFTSEGASLEGTPEIICEATATSPVGEYPIIIRKGSVTNFNDRYVNGTLTVIKAPLYIKADDKSMTMGETLPEFTLSYEGFKNNETEEVLTKKPVVSCEATEMSAPGNYDITLSGAEAQNYEIEYVNGTLTINDVGYVMVTAKSYTRVYGEPNPTFEFTSEGARLFGTPEIICEATATSPVGEYPIIIRKGSVTNSNDYYINGVLTITEAQLMIIAEDKTMKVGDPMPKFTVIYEGFKNNETEDVLLNLPEVSCSAYEDSPPGKYIIVPCCAQAENYMIDVVNGTLTITEAAPVTITAKSYTREYGEANPVFEYTSEGADVEGTPEIICNATASSPVGEYPIVIRKGSVSNSNDSYVNGVLTITKAPLTITAGNYTKKQYDPMPDFLVNYDGFKNGETADVLTKQVVISCDANEDSAPGEYDITLSGAEAENYDITYVAGKLTVNEPDSYTLTYLVDGEVYQSFSIKYRDVITPLDGLEKEGYTFSGWSEIPATMPAHDVVITGTFKVNKYLLTYQVDGEIVKSDSIVFNTPITPEAEPSKEGYTFSGWSEIPATMPAHDVVITGTFKVNKYLLTYQVDGEIVKSDSIVFNTAITPEAEPTKEGYTFSGWSEIPETMPANDVIVTGTFKINKYLLTYKVDDEIVKSDSIVYNTAITPEAEPMKEGYTFSGWSEIPETMPAHDLTIYGTFTINTYKLTYMIDDAVYKVVDYEYGATITPEPQPEGDYASFEWVELPETMPAHDVTVHASYVTGITDISTAEKIVRIYTPNGKVLNKPQKGLNLVLMRDGTIRKIVIK